MNKLLMTIAFTLLLCVKGFSQQMLYDDCSYLQQFEGTWKYQNGVDEVTFFLKFQRLQIGQDLAQDNIYIRDYLIGWHEYKNNGVVVETDFANRFMTIPTPIDDIIDDISIYLRFDKTECTCAQSSRALYGNFLDLNFSQRKNLTAVINSTGTTMTCILTDKETGANDGVLGLTIPQSFTLIKQ